MINNVLNFVGMKIRKNRNDNGSIGYGRQVRDCPVCRVFSEQCNFIPLFDIVFTEDIMKKFDFRCDFGIG